MLVRPVGTAFLWCGVIGICGKCVTFAYYDYAHGQNYAWKNMKFHEKDISIPNFIICRSYAIHGGLHCACYSGVGG